MLHVAKGCTRYGVRVVKVCCLLKAKTTTGHFLYEQTYLV
jgi:hypothetical protein